MKKRTLGKGLLSLLDQVEVSTDTVAINSNSAIPNDTFSNQSHSKNHPVSANANAKEGDFIYYLPLADLAPNPEQPRKTFSEDSIAELAASIQNHGLLQPIIVCDSNSVAVKSNQTRGREAGAKSAEADIQTKYLIIAGERRYRAAQKLNLSTIPAIIKNLDQGEETLRFLAVIENLQREDLNPLEEALSFQQLISSFSLTHQQLAEKLGKSRAYITNSLRLLKLADDLQQAVRQDDISMSHARLLMNISNRQDQLDIYHAIIKENLSVHDTKKLIDRKLNPKRSIKSVTDSFSKSIQKARPHADAPADSHHSSHQNSNSSAAATTEDDQLTELATSLQTALGLEITIQTTKQDSARLGNSPNITNRGQAKKQAKAQEGATKGAVHITYNSLEELDNIVQILLAGKDSSL